MWVLGCCAIAFGSQSTRQRQLVPDGGILTLHFGSGSLRACQFPGPRTQDQLTSKAIKCRKKQVEYGSKGVARQWLEKQRALIEATFTAYDNSPTIGGRVLPARTTAYR